MDMVREFLQFNQQHQLISHQETILCAVSGGADSMALAHLLHTEGYAIHVAHYHHHIRGDEAHRDAKRVEDWCIEHHIPFVLGHGNVPECAKEQKKSLEEMARIMRYDFLEQTARSSGCTRITTAHHGDDNVETVLFNLVRGTGLQGLTGIPPRRGNIVRPLLGASRASIRAYLAQHQVPFHEDSTNQDTAHTRNYLRHQVVPLLKELNPNLVTQVGETAQHLTTDNQFLLDQSHQQMGQVEFSDTSASVHVSHLAQLPESLAIRVISTCFHHVGLTQYSRQHLRSTLSLAHAPSPSGQIDLPQGLTACRQYNQLVFGAKNTTSNWEPVEVVLDGVTPFGDGWSFRCQSCICPEESNHPKVFYLALSQLSGTLQIRSRQIGDTITLKDRNTKTVKKLLIDSKIPVKFRNSLPVIADDYQTYFLGSFGWHHPSRATAGQTCYKITLLASPTDGSE